MNLNRTPIAFALLIAGCSQVPSDRVAYYDRCAERQAYLSCIREMTAASSGSWSSLERAGIECGKFSRDQAVRTVPARAPEAEHLAVMKAIPPQCRSY